MKKAKVWLNAWLFHYRRFRRGYSNLPNNSHFYSFYKACRMMRGKTAYMSGRKLSKGR